MIASFIEVMKQFIRNRVKSDISVSGKAFCIVSVYVPQRIYAKVLLKLEGPACRSQILCISNSSFIACSTFSSFCLQLDNGVTPRVSP